ncbi:Taste receptor type 1 member 1 [Saguinus oedipus]|uniref:Taste receptor type 1 member 1 n=1 Tax=Saguinus oedipus TaxID=9490 RepID=A0ABQ9V8Z8_SAGOE|nr:Taste receptor type 1 member 1 [Saguinus oedipus]
MTSEVPFYPQAWEPGTFDDHGYHLFQAMRLGVEEINNSTALLPNVTLGYQLYDVCSDSANVYATLRVLSLQGPHHIKLQGDLLQYSPKVLAVIGTDNTNQAATTAALLSPFLVPLISYAASSTTLSMKQRYPSFLCTIPSDKYQVEIMVLLLQRFRWTWISLVGSSGDYGQLGVQALEDQATVTGWQLARVFFESVVLANLTGKVWIASEDWAMSTYISGVPGIRRIGTVLGVAIQQRTIPGLKAFEEAYASADKGAPRPCPKGSWCSSNQLCRECQAFTTHRMPELTAFSMSAAYNAYQAVYAVAHGLHQLLGCAFGACSRDQVYPWQGQDSENQSSRSGKWFMEVLEREGLKCPPFAAGCSHWIVASLICGQSYQDLYRCQPCGKEEWAPDGSQTCFPRTVVFLAWHEHTSWVLLAANTLLLLLLLGTAGLFAWHLDTPVVRSAGGRLCFLMLGSLAAGSSSLYGFFGEPTWPACLLRPALFALGFTIFLSCLTVRSFQLVIIFKFSTKVPTFYHAWVQNHGAGLFVMISSAAQLLICLTWLVVWTPLPTREYQRFPQLVVLECTEASSLGFILAFLYNGLLSISAFACSYLGKGLPENYNEAKCVTFSLLFNFVSWIAFFTTASVYDGKYLPAVIMLAVLSSLSSGFGGYFLPKCYVILCRPDLNSTEHFQASIQDYTRRRSST